MGWTYLARAPRDMRAFLDANYAPAIVRSEIVGDTYYAAARLDDGRVVAVVTLIDGAGWKTMDESAGPYRWDCPADILALLTEPAPTPWAQAWRDRCRARLLEVAS
jgi:hypothetical protein